MQIIHERSSVIELLFAGNIDIGTALEKWAQSKKKLKHLQDAAGIENHGMHSNTQPMPNPECCAPGFGHYSTEKDLKFRTDHDVEIGNNTHRVSDCMSIQNRNAVRSFAKRSGGIFNGPVISIDWMDVRQYSHPSYCDKKAEERAVIDKNFHMKYCVLLSITEVQESLWFFQEVLIRVVIHDKRCQQPLPMFSMSTHVRGILDLSIGRVENNTLLNIVTPLAWFVYQSYHGEQVLNGRLRSASYQRLTEMDVGNTIICTCLEEVTNTPRDAVSLYFRLKGAGGLLSPDEIKDDNASKFASRSRGGTTTVRLGVGAMNTEQRSCGETTCVRLGVGAMNTEQRSRGTGAHSVGTVEELTLLFLKN
jgi:hypothetical protein